MRYSENQKQQTRSRIIDEAARAFRLHGYAGIGIDGIAAAAGVTSGALYSHFRSKAELFAEVVRSAIERLIGGVRREQERHPDQWLHPFAEYYVGQGHRENIAGGCGLPSLSPEIVRSDEQARAAFREGLEAVLCAMTERAPLNGDADQSREIAWAILALLSGGVMLARAVGDDSRGSEISRGVNAAVSLIEAHFGRS